MEIKLTTDRVQVEDKGVIKEVECAGRTLMDILEEIQQFAHTRGVKTPTRIFEIILKKLGFPDADVFLSKDNMTKDDEREFSNTLNVLESLKDEFLSPSGTAKLSDEAKKLLTIATEVAEANEATDKEETREKKPSIWDGEPQSKGDGKLIYSFHWENLPVKSPTSRTKARARSDPRKKRFNWDDSTEMDTAEEIAAEEETAHG